MHSGQTLYVPPTNYKAHGSMWSQFYTQLLRNYNLHPEETSKNSDNCNFLKVSDIGKSIVVNGETYILNDTAQFSEDMREIYI